MRVDVYSNGIRVSELGGYGTRACYDFCRTLAQHTFEKNGRGKFVRVVKGYFATAFKDRTEFRFHRNSLDAFLRHIDNQSINERVEVVRHIPLSGKPIELVKIDTRKAREQQPQIIEYLSTPTGTGVVQLQTGKGKMQPLDALVKVPGGWKRNGDLALGETVISSSGQPCEVVGLFPQGYKETYGITFEDGRYTECGIEHWWSVYYGTNAYNEQSHLASTQELIQLLEQGIEVRNPLSVSEIGEEAVLPIPPFLYGIAVITGKIEGSYKGIELEYLNASNQQRMDLLTGILSRTTLAPIADNKVMVNTLNPNLTEDVIYLVRSLGGTAKATALPVNSTVISHPFLRTFLVDGKANGVDYPSYEPTLETLTVKITSIVPVGIKEQQCISINDPLQLYITDDFVVTHNTFCALSAIDSIRERTTFIIKPMYVEKWVGDIQEYFAVEEGDIVTVSGSLQLLTLLVQLQQEVIDPKFILISNATYRNWITSYEETSGFGDEWPCTPANFFEFTQTGIFLIDEVHQDFKFNFIMDCYTHVKKGIRLSATLQVMDRFLQTMYELMMPPLDRFINHHYHKYIAVEAIFYRINEIKSFRYMNYARQSYSQVKFEQSLLQKPGMLKRYSAMLSSIIKDRMKDLQPDQRMLIFAGTIPMCTHLTEYLQEQFPLLNVGRVVGGDDKQKVTTESDIIVSTLKSLGTAFDIHGLRWCIMTDSVDSQQAVEQALGRLRVLKDYPETTPIFIYLVCETIPKHVAYHRNKKNHLRDKVLSMKEFISTYSI